MQASFTDVQWLLCLQDKGCYCMLFDTSRCDPLQMFSGYYICKIMVVRWPGKLLLWFSYAYNYHCFFRLSATRVTTLWLKQRSCFYSGPVQKQGGRFNHRVVTLVADKLERQWLWEFYFGVRD